MTSTANNNSSCGVNNDSFDQRYLATSRYPFTLAVMIVISDRFCFIGRSTAGSISVKANIPDDKGLPRNKLSKETNHSRRREHREKRNREGFVLVLGYFFIWKILAPSPW
ncbi:hypothetical protein [Nostoc sp.]|uniref:hypothetical protein n=1 Tax=Nostoc sp. TaxID=1180 RepID=UPI002FFAD080